jgi:hypothetical protein
MTASRDDSRSSQPTAARVVRRVDSSVNNRCNNAIRTGVDRIRPDHVVIVWDFMTQIGVQLSVKLAIIAIGAIILRGHVADARKRAGNSVCNRDASLPALKAGAASESHVQRRTYAIIYWHR